MTNYCEFLINDIFNIIFSKFMFGLTYSKREQFLSEVILRFGELFEVHNDWGELFKNNT